MGGGSAAVTSAVHPIQSVQLVQPVLSIRDRVPLCRGSRRGPKSSLSRGRRLRRRHPRQATAKIIINSAISTLMNIVNG